MHPFPTKEVMLTKLKQAFFLFSGNQSLNGRIFFKEGAALTTDCIQCYSRAFHPRAVLLMTNGFLDRAKFPSCAIAVITPPFNFRNVVTDRHLFLAVGVNYLYCYQCENKMDLIISPKQEGTSKWQWQPVANAGDEGQLASWIRRNLV